MKERIISALIGLVLLAGIMLLGSVAVRIAAGLVAVIMVFELARATKERNALMIPTMLMAALWAADVLPVRTEVIGLYLVILFVIMLFRHTVLHIKDVGLLMLFAIYVGAFLGCISKIRCGEAGAWRVWLVFIGAWGSDIFAYLAGMLFGKHKLMPSVSPKKTVEGAIGGVIGTTACYLVYGILAGDRLELENIVILAVLGALVSVIGQIGDLTASAIKRQYGIKDYGKIMPGHGGLTDRFDSILFVAPCLYLFLQIIG